MPVKRKIINNNPIILMLLILLTVVTVYMIMERRNNTNEMPKPAQPSPPSVIVIDNKTDRLPIYPKDLPRYSSSDYQQVGILTSQETDKEPIVLPLYGRKLYNRSDRWQYYTATDKDNLMRLPLFYQGRDCEDDVGCNEIYTGDKLTVDIYQGREFTATVYRTQAPRYFADAY